MILILISSSLSAKDFFVIDDDKNRKIPTEFYLYYEGDIKDSRILEVDNSSWNSELKNHQSYINGFWIKYRIKNESDFNVFGLDHLNHQQKKVIIEYESTKEIKEEYIDISKGFLDAIVSNHFYDNIKVEIPKNEVITVYSYNQSVPFSRWHGLANPYERTSVGEWKSLVKEQIKKVNVHFIFTVFVSSLFLYLLVHLLIDFSLTYLWMVLLTLSLSLFYGITEKGIAFHIGLTKFFTISEFYSLIVASAIFSFNQFAYNILQHEYFSFGLKRIHYAFQIIIGFFFSVNFLFLLFFPGSYELDLRENPIKNIALGPSLLPPIMLVMAWIVYLIPLIFFAAKSTYYRRSCAFYMLVSIFFLCFIPIKYASIKYLPTGDLLDIYLSDEFVLGIMLLMMSFTASQKIRTTEEGYLNAQLMLKDAYSRFVPEELTEHLLKESIVHVGIGDQRQMEMSILFTDIRDFTTLSEKLSPVKNFEFVNKYLEHMVPIVNRFDGFVNKFIGDSIMAIYPNNADDAVQSAVAMMEELRIFNFEREERGEDFIRIGLGINSGKMMLGTLGNNERMEASVISNAVNLASRLESLTKFYKVPLLISGETQSKLSPNRFRLRKIDRVAVKGKQEQTDIYEVLDGYRTEVMMLKQRQLPLFQKAYDLYENDEIDQALTLFKGCLEEDPKDHVSKIYVDRCERGEKRKRDKWYVDPIALILERRSDSRDGYSS